MHSDFQTVELLTDDNIATLRLNQPRKRNPLTIELQQELRQALALVRDSKEVHALILTGNGEGFCSGAELGSLGATSGDASSIGHQASEMMATLSHPLIMDLQQLPVPVVAAVNGAAAGAGASLALAADIVIAARSAYFLLPFTPKLGILPDLGATWQLPRQLGRARATGVALLGDRLTAEQAADWGLIWACSDDTSLMDDAAALARRLAALAPDMALELRQAFDQADRNGIAAQMEYERQRQIGLLNRPAFREGVAAFLEKRPPAFRK